jgi:hypothetical protein
MIDENEKRVVSKYSFYFFKEAIYSFKLGLFSIASMNLTMLGWSATEGAPVS